MKKIALIFLFGISTLQAQQNTTSTGGEAIGTGGSASYSVGQIDYVSNSDSNFSVSQGVQQPFEISVVLGLEENYIKLNLAAYPNPTNDILFLSIENGLSQELTYQLIDLQGKLIENNVIKNNTTEIKLAHLEKAIYFLNITENNKSIKTFKIIKN
jgi:hypothetical protein